MIERIHPAGVPTPRAPYSPAVRAGNFIYVSGQGPIDAATNQFSIGTIEHEVHLVLTNIQRILAGCGATMQDVIKVNVYLRSGDDFQAMNSVYAQFFGESKPARTTIECKFANKEMKVEIDCVAYKE
jgi:2-iminobutanoate/2-iminopropanoate deaminase